MFPDLQPFSYAEVAVGTAVVSLAVPGEAVFATIRFGGGAVNYRVDGGDPSATLGLPALDGDQLPLWYQSLSQFRAVRSGGADGTLRVTFHRKR